MSTMDKISVRVVALLVAGMAGVGCTNPSGLHRGAGQADAGCEGGAAPGSDGEVGAGYPDAGDDSTDAELDSAVDAAVFGNCITADDCFGVLNYRTGFECWWPSGASRADVSRDPCLVPWKPNPQCTTAAPPAGCPGGLQPVTHSCIVTRCPIPVCTEGKCLISFAGPCDTADAGPTKIDCDDLRATYLNALAAAQQCYPGQDFSRCSGSYPDACGCQAPYDVSGYCADAVSSAFADWQNASCPMVFASCGKPCGPTTTTAGATCVPNPSGTMGTCAWK